MTTKFAKNQRHGKTPAVCKKSAPPDPDLLPPGPFPSPAWQYVNVSIDYRNITAGHPWQYCEVQKLQPLTPYRFFTDDCLDPEFISFEFTFNYHSGTLYYNLRLAINHCGTVHTIATSALRMPKAQSLFIPPMYLETDNPANYTCRVALFS